VTAARTRQPRPQTYQIHRPVFQITVQWLRPEEDGSYDLDGAIRRLGRTHGFRTFKGSVTDAAALAYSTRTKAQAKVEGDGHWAVLLPDDADPGLIAHEAVHIANKAFRHNSWKATHKNDEHFASTVQAVVGLIELARPA
jgi:hypothetical protein